MSKAGKHSKCFFDKEHFKTLDTKLDLPTYRQFIRKIHLRVCEEMILSTKEGYIMPCKLGDIRVDKQKKKEGIFTTHSALTKGRKEFNAHSFGYIYSIIWDKRIRAEYYRHNRSHLVPKYKNNPIMWFTIYRFTGTREYLKRALAKKIFNQDLFF